MKIYESERDRIHAESWLENGEVNNFCGELLRAGSQSFLTPL